MWDTEVGFGSQVVSSWAWILYRISKHTLLGLCPPPFEAVIKGQRARSGLQPRWAPVVGLTSNMQSESEP